MHNKKQKLVVIGNGMAGMRTNDTAKRKTHIFLLD